MKKLFFAAFSLVALLATSCSQDENLTETSPVKNTTFKLNVPTDGIGTRAADSNVKRYVMAIDGVDLGAADGASASISNATGTFDISNLQAGKEYTAYFWADYDAPDATDPTYDTKWLTWVSLTKVKDETTGEETGTYKPVTMAYCGKLTFTAGSETSYNVTLKRAVAKVNLIQTPGGQSTGDWVTARCNTATNYDVSNYAPHESSGTTSQASYQQITEGAVADGVTLFSFYILAPSAEASLTDVAIEVNNTAKATVSNVPLQANYQTNIKGAYINASSGAKFVVTTDDTWGGSKDDQSF